MMNSKQKSDPKLSKQSIVRRAIELADTHGFEKLSMRKLAASLDVEAMSLYHYFSNKRELVAEMVDALVPVLEQPDCIPDWRQAMRKRAHALRETFLSHPWMPHQLISGINIGPSMLAYTDATIGYLVRAGFSIKMTDYAWNVIDSYIYGFNLQAQNFPLDPSEYQEAAKQYIPSIPQSQYPYMYDMSMQVAEGTHDGMQDFDFGLDIILSALEEMRIKDNK